MGLGWGANAGPENDHTVGGGQCRTKYRGGNERSIVPYGHATFCAACADILTGMAWVPTAQLSLPIEN